MTAWIDPNLLQLVGLGTKDDVYLQDGRHLRWFFGRLLGFPRTGFELQRTPSPITPQRWNEIAAAGDVLRFQELSQAIVGPFRHRFANGLTVSKEGGLVYQATDSGSFVRVDAKPVRLDFGHEGPSATPPSGPAASNPAAWVRLTVVRRKLTGSVVARAYSSGRGTWNFQDWAAVGVHFGTLIADLNVADRLMVDGTETAGSLVHRLGTQGVRAWRSAADTQMRSVRPRRPSITRPGFPLQPVLKNPWVAETLLLHGGLIERIDIVGQDAVVMRAEWFPTRAYAALPVWKDVDRFFLPITDVPEIYPAWTTLSGEEVAKLRVMSDVPRALPPWDEPTYPPPPPASGAVDEDLARRYLGLGYERMREAMKIFLDGELSTDRPQALINVPETLEAEPPDESFDSGTMDVYPFDLLVGASVDPHAARLLGLLTTDKAPLDGMWDYKIDAGFPGKWLLWTILEAISPIPIEDIDDVPLTIPGLGKLKEQGMRPELCISIATGIESAFHSPPTSPEDLRADVVPVPAGKPIEAEVGLTWVANAENLFQAPERVRIFFAVRRRDGSGEDVPLHPKDDESGVLLPHVPTRSVIQNGRVGLRDSSVPSYGSFTWRVSGMDLWGRFSPFAEVTSDVRDMIPPPAPASLRAVLVGAEENAPSWSTFRITFDWSEGATIASPDVDRFEVHIRQGAVSPDDGESPSTWGHTEHVPGATAPPLRIAWPSGALTAPPGVSASIAMTPIPADQGGGTRVIVEIGPVVVPFNAAGQASLTGTVRAFDQSGNASPFARPATATRADLAPPPPPPPTGVLRFGTRPDALGRSSFRIAFTAPAGGMTQVMRCSGAALLGFGGVDDATFQSLDETARVTLLQTLSTLQREIFAMDHDVAYPESATSHVIELNGNDRGWTVATTIGISRTGVREQWPSDPLRFDVIAVPRTRVPKQPVVLEARGGDRSAALRIAPDSLGVTLEYRIYRTRDQAATADVRSMRPIGTVTASNDATLFVDSGLFPNTFYFYRVEAIGDGGVRSQPTSPITVEPYTTEPPLPPEVMSVQRPANPSKRRVEWLLPRRDYAVALLRRMHGTPWWTPADTPASRPDGSLDLSVLTSTVENGAYRYGIEDLVPDAAARWAYRVRVVDPQGRVSSSPAVEEAP